MPGRHDKAEPGPNPGLLARRDLLQPGAGGFDALCENAEIALAGHLEADIIHAGHIGRAQHDAVPVELVEGAQIDTAVGLAADLVQPDPIDVMPHRGIDIGDPDLDVAGSQHTVERHLSLPCSSINCRRACAKLGAMSLPKHPVSA